MLRKNQRKNYKADLSLSRLCQQSEPRISPGQAFYVNGNNLFLITKMPDDRESNYGFSGGGGAYPTVRRYNFGVKLNI